MWYKKGEFFASRPQYTVDDDSNDLSWSLSTDRIGEILFMGNAEAAFDLIRDFHLEGVAEVVKVFLRVGKTIQK